MFLVLTFFGSGMKTDLFQLRPLLSFPKLLHIEWSSLTASYFRIWNHSTGMAPPLALFLVILPQAHFTSHSRMSDSRWVTTPSWLSASLRPFLYNSPVYSCHLFLISFASVSPYSFYPLSCPSCMKYSLGICNFLEEISSLSHSIVFLYFSSLSTSESFLISSCYSLDLCIQMGILVLFSFAFHFSFLSYL